MSDLAGAAVLENSKKDRSQFEADSKPEEKSGNPFMDELIQGRVNKADVFQHDPAVEMTDIRVTTNGSGAGQKTTDLNPILLSATASGALVETTSLFAAKHFAAKFEGLHAISDVATKDLAAASKAGSLLTARSELKMLESELLNANRFHDTTQRVLAEVNKEVAQHARQYANPTLSISGMSQERVRATHMFYFGSESSNLAVGAGKGLEHPVLSKYIGSLSEVNSGQKLFYAAGEEAQSLLKLDRSLAEALNAQSHLASTEFKYSSLRLGLAQEELKFASQGYLKTAIQGAGKGLMLGSLTVAAGYGLDKILGDQFGFQSKMDATNRLLLDGLALPAILMSNLKGREKLLLATGTFLSSRALDYLSSGADANESKVGFATMRSSNLLRPNLVDGVLVTSAALAPLPAKEKALAIATAYLGGRAYNIVSDRINNRH
ncbi:MAG: hypothetical protein K2X27_06365 [Candidatus Obscuribacterales bacterium]|nr:hypothetical protein [Candidatus Obscuribacterales bacterium]